jgi:uncharacterized OsmC-like protein
MKISSVTYKGQLRTEATHLASGNTFITDAPVDNHGKGQAFSPTDLMSTSLASCMLTIMGIAAETHGIDITGTVCSVEKYMEANPRRVGRILATLTMPAISYDEKQKAILEKAARTCPVSLSLSEILLQDILFHWNS